MQQQLDLLEWAASRPASTIIDARQKFLARETAFLRLLMIGFQPPTSGGSVVNLADYRQRRTTKPAEPDRGVRHG